MYGIVILCIHLNTNIQLSSMAEYESDYWIVIAHFIIIKSVVFVTLKVKVKTKAKSNTKIMNNLFQLYNKNNKHSMTFGCNCVNTGGVQSPVLVFKNICIFIWIWIIIIIYNNIVATIQPNTNMKRICCTYLVYSLLEKLFIVWI